GQMRNHRLPWQRALRAAPDARGNERAAARHGGDAILGAVQPRPPDVRGAEALRHREAVRPALEPRDCVDGRLRGHDGSVAPVSSRGSSPGSISPRVQVPAAGWIPATSAGMTTVAMRFVLARRSAEVFKERGSAGAERPPYKIFRRPFGARV